MVVFVPAKFATVSQLAKFVDTWIMPLAAPVICRLKVKPLAVMCGLAANTVGGAATNCAWATTFWVGNALVAATLMVFVGEIRPPRFTP